MKEDIEAKVAKVETPASRRELVKSLLASAEILRCIGHPGRLMALVLIHATDFSVGELALALGMAQPVLSTHLRILKGANLVESATVDGRKHYRLTPNGESVFDLTLKLEARSRGYA